jgi:hypothetical protein
MNALHRQIQAAGAVWQARRLQLAEDEASAGAHA